MSGYERCSFAEVLPGPPAGAAGPVDPPPADATNALAQGL